MVDEDGADVGRTVGDLMKEVSAALVELYGKKEPTALRGDRWQVFRAGPTLHAVIYDEAWASS